MAAELGAEPGSQFLTLRPDRTSVQHSLPLLLLSKPLQLCPGLKRQLSKASGCPGTGRFGSHLLLCRTLLLGQPQRERVPFWVPLAMPSGDVFGCELAAL